MNNAVQAVAPKHFTLNAIATQFGIPEMKMVTVGYRLAKTLQKIPRCFLRRSWHALVQCCREM